MSGVRFAPEATRELLEVARWYESRQVGLADRFLEEVEAFLPLIDERPAMFPRVRDVAAGMAVRRALLSRFPYALVFVDTGSHRRVVAVAHQRRRPLYWIGRL